MGVHSSIPRNDIVAKTILYLYLECWLTDNFILDADTAGAIYYILMICGLVHKILKEEVKNMKSQTERL